MAASKVAEPRVALVVETNPALRAAIAGALADEDFDVSTTASADEARTILRRSPPAILVLHIGVRDDAALVLLEELVRTGCAPPVLLTSTIAARVASVAARYGVPYLIKPCDLGALVSAVVDAHEKQVRPAMREAGSDGGISC